MERTRSPALWLGCLPRVNREEMEDIRILTTQEERGRWSPLTERARVTCR
jgi:hypothetical protein